MIWSAAQYVMSAVVFKIYDVDYDTKRLKRAERMVTVRLLAAIKEKNSKDMDRDCHI